MKKIIILIGIISTMFTINSVKANTINSIDMNIYVDINGNATVKETWNYKSSKNTEIYHQYLDLGNASITDYSVSDSTGTNYTFNTSWDINGNFESKQYKFGYHYISNGVELCLGISHYGTYSYYLTYKINGFVAQLEDAQVIYWTLLQPTSEKLKQYNIKVYADKKFSDTLDVWGYGNYGGLAYVYNGEILLSSENSLSSNEYVVLLAKFPNETFNTTNKVNKTFTQIYDMAEEGSTHYTDNSSKTSFFNTLLNTIFMFLWPAIMFFVFYKVTKNSSGNDFITNKILPKKDVQMFRDLPFKSDIFTAYLIANEYNLMKKNTDFLGALLLKWIKNDNVEITTEEKGIFKTKSTKIIMKNQPIGNEQEIKMYERMRIASKDNILESKEFERYCSKNYSEFFTWFKDVAKEEFNKLKGTSYLKEVETKSLFGKKYVFSATSELNEKAQQMAGLKLFFKEFTSMKEKTAIEVKMWQEYLMYAQIFGVADEVAKEFKKIYPDIVPEETYNTIILVHNFSYASVRSASTARSQAQSYSSGGGGFSSGGGGGGSFGGGGGGSMGSR